MEGIDAILYINLDHRTDRKKSILKQIQKIGFNPSKIHHISAIYNKECGHLGCGQSHIKALELAIQNNWDCILILEDDFRFTVSADVFNAYMKEAATVSWDVLLLAKGHFSGRECIGNLQKVKACTTTSGYIVKKHYYKTLRANFVDSVTYMKDQLEKHVQHHTDLWKIIGHEFDKIDISEKTLVRYGHPQGKWIEKTVTENFKATNEFFGLDPYPNHLKYVHAYAPHKTPSVIPKLIHGVEAIDTHWRILQARDNFYIFDPVVGSQGGFSSDTF
jgi:hypothetical protein